MNQYAIYEGNYPRLEKKLAAIEKKCKKFGCTFTCNEVERQVRKVKCEDGIVRYLRYIVIEVDGTAKLNDWEFVATLEHKAGGNIIRSAIDSAEIPDRFYTCQPTCEHCNSARPRKDTYIVRNTVTGEFLQVGSSCLQAFTNGISAEHAAAYMSWFEELAEFETCSTSFGNHASLIPVEEYLTYVIETIRHYGFITTTAAREAGYFVEPTKDVAYDFLRLNNLTLPAQLLDSVREKYNRVNFRADSEENKKAVEEALNWILNKDVGTDQYLNNLKVACDQGYAEYRDLGIIASLFASYRREIEHLEVKKAREAAQKAEAEGSQFQGNIKDRIQVKVSKVECVASWESEFGYTHIWKITDPQGNVYTWKTGNILPEDTLVLVGTVKDHTVFRDVKQTELTRCKVLESKAS